LPNVRLAAMSDPQAKATCFLDNGSGTPNKIEYSLGDNITDLKRFSVFDSKSILIHLDKSNHVKFTPAQIKIFDKVAATISKLEEKLNNEKNARKKDNPFQSMFLDSDTTETAVFCKGITGATKESDFLKHASFNPTTDDSVISELQKSIDEKKKLDIPKRKSQLAADRQNLAALKATLQGVIDQFADAKVQQANQLIKDILEKIKIVESLSVQSFNNGILSTIGSPEWKSLISAAKELYECEKASNKGKEPEHCLLCHRQLTKNEKSLFQKYWQFLESKAEEELSRLVNQQSSLLQELHSTKITYPKFLVTDAGVKVLNDENSEYMTRLKVQFKSLGDTLDDWNLKIGKFHEVSCSVPAIDLTPIDIIIENQSLEESKLVDPADEITNLTAQLNSLKHKKKVTEVKDAGLEYIGFLHWLAKVEGVRLSGIKMATTKKRTEAFLVSVARNYKGLFNQELARLDCDFNLVMNTSGEQGSTVKEYRLDFAEDYNPSQILSEGEQNACSLADFLTEVQLDRSNCGIIFDDPVTSLDHERKDKIAKRLAEESGHRQVVAFTHDIVFMSKLVKHADMMNIPTAAHWMRKVNGVPGCVEDNTSPKLASLASLKNDSQESVKNYASLGAKEQERALGAAFDYLRSACEALIEEVLFANTIQRYEDHIRVQNLNDVLFDQASALKIVDLHGRISKVILAHDRSDQLRENLPSLKELEMFRKEFNELEAGLKALRKAAINDRKVREETMPAKKVGW